MLKLRDIRLNVETTSCDEARSLEAVTSGNYMSTGQVHGGHAV